LARDGTLAEAHETANAALFRHCGEAAELSNLCFRTWSLPNLPTP